MSSSNPPDSSVGAYFAKTNLAALLDRVAAGERITITRHGHPVAELVPPAGEPATTVDDAIRELRAFRSTHPLGEGLTLRQLINEGRRV